MTRTVRDAALLLDVMAGADPADRATHNSRHLERGSYTGTLDKDGLRGARIGVARNFFGFHDHVDRLMEEAIGVLRRLGAEAVDPANVAGVKALSEPEWTVLLSEFKADLNDYLGRLGPDAPVHSLAEAIAFNQAHAERVMPFFGQEAFEQRQAKGTLDDAAYREAVATCRRLARDEGIDATLEEHALDAIFAPSGGPVWLTDWVNGDHFGGGSSTPAAVAGYPNITVPAGRVFGLPVGISFFGGAYQEAILLRLAYAFEQATQARQKPAYLTTLQLDA